MARRANSSFSLLEQVAKLAPTVSDLIHSKHARITAAVTSHDVTGGYGNAFTFHLKLELYVEQCNHCGETQYSAPVLDCYGHRVERRYMQVADAEGSSLEKALAKLEAAVGWDREERRRAA